MAEEGTAKALRMSFFAAALFAVASRLVWANLVGVLDGLRPGASLDLVSVTALFAVSTLLFVFAIARLYAREMPLRELLGLRPVAFGVLLLAGVAAAGAEMPVALLERSWAARFPLSETEQSELGRILTMDTLRGKVVVFGSLGLVWPVLHELLYRGAIFGRLRPGRDALLVTFAVASFYAFSLGSPRGIISAAFVGLVTTALRAASGSTLAAIVFHASYMSLAVLRELRGPTDEALTGRLVMPWAAAGAVAALALAALLRRDTRSLAYRGCDGVVEE